MSLTEKTNHVTEALARLIDQFKNQPNIEKLLESWIQQVQEIEAAAFAVLEDTKLDTAAGVQLDGIGDIVGEERQGRTDADYRLALATRINLNNSRGTAEDLITIVRGMVGDKEIQVSEDFPSAIASFNIIVNDPIDIPGTDVGAFVTKGRGAGIKGVFQWHQTTTPFGFDGDVEASGFGAGEFASAAGV